MHHARRQPETARIIALALVMAFVSSACARAPQSGVNVKPLTTELVFGVPKKEKSAPPPNSGTVPEDPLPVVDIPRFNIPKFSPLPDAPRAPVKACKEAGPTDFPKKAATTIVDLTPAVGVYEWRVVGTQNVASVGRVKLTSVLRKTIKNFKPLGTNQFQYDVEEREIVFGSTTTVTQTFYVRQTQDGINEDGIFLTRVRTRTEQNPKAEATFSPQPPIKLLPLPVKIGSPSVGGAVQQPQLDTTGVDPASQEALRHRGTVLNRYSVDACGTVIQGWFVQGQRDFVSASDRNGDGKNDTYTSSYNYMFATQYGGIQIFEHNESPCAQKNDTDAETRKKDPTNSDTCNPAGDLNYSSHIGQLTPDPV